MDNVGKRKFQNVFQVQLSKEELEEVIKEAKSHLATTEEDGGTMNAEGEQDEFNFDKYDEEEGTGLGIDSAVEVGNEENVAFSDSDTEKEDDIIKPDDNLVIVGHVEGDASILEIFGT